MSKQGRPPLPESEKRSNRIEVAFTNAELASLDSRRLEGERRGEALRRLAGVHLPTQSEVAREKLEGIQLDADATLMALVRGLTPEQRRAVEVIVKGMAPKEER